MVALGRLPARQREVITLRLLLDLDTETTAQVLGIAPERSPPTSRELSAPSASRFRPLTPNITSAR